jgi:Ca2+/Na+ antiporter
MEPKYTKVFTIYSFLVSISALTVVCSILVNFVELIQLLTGVNSVFLGLTVFAWANSIGGNVINIF